MLLFFVSWCDELGCSLTWIWLNLFVVLVTILIFEYDLWRKQLPIVIPFMINFIWNRPDYSKILISDHFNIICSLKQRIYFSSHFFLKLVTAHQNRVITKKSAIRDVGELLNKKNRWCSPFKKTNTIYTISALNNMHFSIIPIRHTWQFQNDLSILKIMHLKMIMIFLFDDF